MKRYKNIIILILVLQIFTLNNIFADANIDVFTNVYTSSEKNGKSINSIILPSGIYEGENFELGFNAYRKSDYFIIYDPTHIKIYYDAEVFDMYPSYPKQYIDGTYCSVTLPYKLEDHKSGNNYYEDGKNYRFTVKENAPSGMTVIKAALFRNNDQVSDLINLKVYVKETKVINITNDDSARIYDPSVSSSISYSSSNQQFTSRYLIYPGTNKITINYKSLNLVNHNYIVKLTSSGPSNLRITTNTYNPATEFNYTSSSSSESLGFIVESFTSTVYHNEKQKFTLSIFDKTDNIKYVYDFALPIADTSAAQYKAVDYAVATNGDKNAGILLGTKVLIDVLYKALSVDDTFTYYLYWIYDSSGNIVSSGSVYSPVNLKDRTNTTTILSGLRWDGNTNFFTGTYIPSFVPKSLGRHTFKLMTYDEYGDNLSTYSFNFNVTQ